MYKGMLTGGVDFVTENGDTLIDGKKLSIIDAAFLACYLIRAGRAEDAAAVIESFPMETGGGKFIEKALWIWIIGEYTNKTKDRRLADRHEARISSLLSLFSGEWMKPHSDWLGLAGEDVYASNIAAAYAAALSVTNFIESEDVRRLLKDLKAFVFQSLLNAGRIVSAVSNREVMGDLGIIAVPFGLIDAGNQLLVESMNVLEEKLVSEGVRYAAREDERSDLTCLLSWYYSERGDIARSKRLLSHAGKRMNEKGKISKEGALSYILYSIAELNIMEKESVWTAKDTGILHSPQGTGNRYLSEPIQRVPLYPLEGEDVVLRMVTQPLKPSQSAAVEYTANGVSEKINMDLVTSGEGEQYWEARLGAFGYGTRVEYRFTVENGIEKTVSDTYNFKVRKWMTAGNVIGAERETDGMIVYYEPLEQSGLYPTLRLSRAGEKSLKMSFFLSVVCPERMQCESFRLEGAGAAARAVNGGLSIRTPEGREHAGKDFIELLLDGSEAVCMVRYRFVITPDERFTGMGERFSHTEYRGLDIDNYVYNQYTNQKLRTYIPVPFTISSGGYGIFADTPMYTVFRFGTRRKDVLEIEADLSNRVQKLDTYLFTGSPKEIMMSFSEAAGKPVLPPKWAFGPWMSSNNWDSQAETMKQAELTGKYAIPATVLVLEQWSDEATYYIFNDAAYKQKDGSSLFDYQDFTFPEWGRWPDPKGMVESLHEKGLKVLLWQVPVMKHMDGIAHSQRDEDERFMIDAGYCVKDQNGRPYRIPSYEWFKRSLVPDFSNPDAKEWWLGKRLYLLKELKIDGFKTDGGECIYGDVVFYDGRTGDEMRNVFPNEYIKCYYDYANVHCTDGAVTFSRAGYTGAQRMPLHWAGDESSTFEAYRASVNAGLSCGMSGVPFWGWDIAGFHGEIPTAELFIRSTQFAAFCPVMQYHAETRGEQNRDRTPWNIAEQTGEPLVLSIYKDLADLRMNMLPYIYEQAKISSTTGLPLMRAMHLEHPDDENCLRAADQYYFGESLLAAPVIQEGSKARDVYFPSGTWIDFFEDERFEGGQSVNVQCGIERIPVYIKENSVIPLNLAESLALCSHVGNQTNGYTNLCFMMYVTEKASCRFEDECGNSIEISAEKSRDVMHIGIFGNIGQPVVLIVRAAGSCKSAERNGSFMTACASAPGLCVNGYCIRNNDLLLKIQNDSEISLT